MSLTSSNGIPKIAFISGEELYLGDSKGYPNCHRFSWNGQEVVFTQPIQVSGLTDLEAILRNPLGKGMEAFEVYSKISDSLPDKFGLVLKPVAIAQSVESQLVYVCEIELVTRELPPWMKFHSKSVWFSPEANPTVAGTPYLSPRVDDNEVYWDLRQVGIDENMSEGVRCVKWNDGEGVKGLAELVFENDYESLTVERSLVEDEGFVEYRKKSSLLKEYDRLWEESSPKSKRASKQRVTTLLRTYLGEFENGGCSLEVNLRIGKTCGLGGHGFLNGEGKPLEKHNIGVSFSVSDCVVSLEFLRYTANRFVREGEGFTLVRFRFEEHCGSLAGKMFVTPDPQLFYASMGFERVPHQLESAPASVVENYKNTARSICEQYDPHEGEWVKVAGSNKPLGGGIVSTLLGAFLSSTV